MKLFLERKKLRVSRMHLESFFQCLFILLFMLFLYSLIFESIYDIYYNIINNICLQTQACARASTSLTHLLN
jgi:hypothetical protein